MPEEEISIDEKIEYAKKEIAQRNAMNSWHND